MEKKKREQKKKEREIHSLSYLILRGKHRVLIDLDGRQSYQPEGEDDGRIESQARSLASRKRTEPCHPRKVEIAPLSVDAGKNIEALSELIPDDEDEVVPHSVVEQSGVYYREYNYHEDHHYHIERSLTANRGGDAVGETAENALWPFPLDVPSPTWI